MASVLTNYTVRDCLKYLCYNGIISAPFVLPEVESVYTLDIIQLRATKNLSHVYKLRFVPNITMCSGNYSLAIEIQDGSICTHKPCIIIYRYMDWGNVIGDIPSTDIKFYTEKSGNLNYILDGRIDIKKCRDFAPGAYETTVAGIPVCCEVY